MREEVLCWPKNLLPHPPKKAAWGGEGEGKIRLLLPGASIGALVGAARSRKPIGEEKKVRRKPFASPWAGRGSACRNDPPAKTERVYKSRIKESAYFIVETSEILLLDAGARGQTAFLYRKKARGSARPSQGRGRAFSCETSVKQAKYGPDVAFFQEECSIFCF